ncbi:MAG: BREX system P-loop protein BrxC, partial [Dehalococcoidia bacterium]
AWEFHRDEVIAALAEVLQQSKESVEKWVDTGADNFTLTVENFARWVKRYLDTQGAEHRLMFLVDEVGQFIGSDTHLMLSLQTITEQLGTVCRGRAWVVVTSQEDLDSVLGEVNQSRQHDFSKIQGRFKTRLSLSSANVDEVIKERLLRKDDAASKPLAAAYEGKHDILRHQLSFLNAGTTFRTYADGSDFAECYPFAAYQFSLVQKVFESIRKAGATGLHLSQGERSTLDAFQSAAKQIGSQEIGALVPFHAFYPAVEGFLDTTVKRTIDLAADNHTLEPFDVTVLKVLFLIRYIEEVPGNVDNLVTLCVDEIDADKLALRKRIEASLERLEKETLVARNGDLYFFLTNEERDIGREIKNVTLASGTEVRELGKLLFEDILGDVRKHSYSVTGRDFTFTRICDDHAVGQKLEGNLEVVFVSPMGDSYGQYASDEGCILATGGEQGRLLIRLPDHAQLGRELRAYLQTENYVKTKHTGSLPDTAKRILRDRSEDNRGRRTRILTMLKGMLGDASYFASGKKLDISRTDPKAALGDALEYLIQNAYPKMGYLKHLLGNPKQEIQSMLRADDVDQVRLGLDTPEANPEALDDLRNYVRLCAMSSKQILLNELIEKRYGGRPYGWPELEVVLLVARLAVLKEINLLDTSKSPIPLDQAYDHLTSSTKQRKVLITLRESAAGELIKQAQSLGHELFAQKGANTEEALFTFLKQKLSAWNAALGSFEPLAKTGKYPGLEQIEAGQGLLRRFVEERDSLPFLKRFVGDKSELLEFAEDFHELSEFYKNQKHSWEGLRATVEALAHNRLQLEAHADAGPALRRMEEILAAPRPYGQLPQVAALSDTARKVNGELVAGARGPAVLEITRLIERVKAELDKVSANGSLRKSATEELQKLLLTATEDTSIAHIAQAVQQAEGAFDRSLSAIEKAQAPPPPKPGAAAPVTPPPAVKMRRVVEVKRLCPDGFLETAEDVTAFLGMLEKTLRAAVDAGERVQIK